MKEIIFYGDDVFFYEFPEDVDIYYAKDPLPPLKEDKNAIKQAIENPISSKRIESLIDKDSKIAICFDDISVPLPLMNEDIRAKSAEVIVKKLITLGIKKENITFICATGLHRKCTSKELKTILGKKIYSQFESQIHNHDVSKEKDLLVVGMTQEGYEVELNRLAAESDLIIYLNITFTPLNGGWKSIIVGLGSFKTIIPHHSPEILQEDVFMDPHKSGLHRIIWEMGRAIEKQVKMFTIEMVINNNFFEGFYEKLYRPLGPDSEKVALWKRLTVALMRTMPQFIKSYVRKKLKANYQLIGVYAGDIERAHKKSLELVKKQLNVPINKQYDVLIYGAPNMSPYNVGSDLNPLLLHTLILGYLYNMYNGRSPLKKDGIIIISNPAYEKFDLQQHPSYYDFYHNIISKNPDIFDLKEVESQYLNNKEYIEKYQKHFAYHGTHAIIVYYWGILGMKNVGDVIIAGAKNKDTLNNLGYKYSKNVTEAIKISKKRFGDDCSIAYFCIPPLFIAELNE